MKYLRMIYRASAKTREEIISLSAQSSFFILSCLHVLQKPCCGNRVTLDEKTNDVDIYVPEPDNLYVPNFISDSLTTLN